MLNLNNLDKREIGQTEYTDSKSRTYTVKHSIILTDNEKRDIEERIAEDLYRIFTSGNRA